MASLDPNESVLVRQPFIQNKVDVCHVGHRRQKHRDILSLNLHQIYDEVSNLNMPNLCENHSAHSSPKYKQLSWYPRNKKRYFNVNIGPFSHDLSFHFRVYAQTVPKNFDDYHYRCLAVCTAFAACSEENIPWNTHTSLLHSVFCGFVNCSKLNSVNSVRISGLFHFYKVNSLVSERLMPNKIHRNGRGTCNCQWEAL